MANPQDIKYSPKLQELVKWKYINEVNQRLDQGDTPNSVWTFIKANGLQIGRPLVYEYAKMRKKALVDGLNIEHMISNAKPDPTSLFDKNDPLTKSSSSKLKSEIDALDRLIQSGYNTLLAWGDRPIAPKTMMEAIKLKSELTDGNHGYLTNYGMENLRQIEQTKYNLIMQHLIQYIPEDMREEAINQIETIEDNYYQTTDYYEEYLRSRGDLSEIMIQKRLEEVAEKQKQLQEEENIDTDLEENNMNSDNNEE